MQCGLLVLNFKSPKTVALVKEKIGHISDGSLSHRADSLKLGLKMAFRRKDGIMLQCYSRSCLLYNNHVSRFSVRSNYSCSNCGSLMECVGCRADWTDGNSSCRRCGKNII